MTRYAKRVDVNHGPIRDAWRRLGWVVEDRSGLGKGEPDLCGRKGDRTVYVEVKNPEGGTVTKAELRRMRELRLQGAEVLIVSSVEELPR